LAKHSFGIIKDPPKEDYLDYEPEKYGCINIDDDIIEKLAWDFLGIPCYWQNLSRPEKGLDYTGISLIPPESAGQFGKIFEKHNGLMCKEIADLFFYAEKEGLFVLHYGI